MQRIKAASVQFHHIPGDKERNLKTIATFVERAAKHDVNLIVFPEMCITGYWHVRNLDEHEVRQLAEIVPQGPSTQELVKLATTYNMTIGAGLIEVSEKGDLYNTYVVVLPDGTVHFHRKLHTFISAYMKSGDTYTVFDTPYGVKMGVLTCYDNNIVENVRITALMGAQVLLAPHQTGGCNSASPKGMKPIDVKLWEQRKDKSDELRAECQGPKGRMWLMRWLPSRAHDNGMFLIFSNGVGRDDDEVRTGNAMILDPYGELLAESKAIEDDMVIAELDLSLVPSSTGRRWLLSRRPDLYDSIAVKTGKEQDTRTVRFTYG
ncbi:MAG: nitrilase family protein [Sphaerochaetaceae bacterium]|jgi:predicted amidohydrolase|nr:nitrilase family protein [Sphaerochaetaceae bacterium]NLO60876.1 acyltransferase [Spirochaetales bacterium]MDD2404939.1 nitrilase family protein [Sphaerochaetaceae bacterium]MDD3669799.1 nitrilase family protein [Sphaerochaetaceae bacterium]MDD4258321.1 nitrilase family protein [Sphaerochaetaceae bacterium]